MLLGSDNFFFILQQLQLISESDHSSHLFSTRQNSNYEINNTGSPNCFPHLINMKQMKNINQNSVHLRGNYCS